METPRPKAESPLNRCAGLLGRVYDELDRRSAVLAGLGAGTKQIAATRLRQVVEQSIGDHEHAFPLCDFCRGHRETADVKAEDRHRIVLADDALSSQLGAVCILSAVLHHQLQRKTAQ